MWLARYWPQIAIAFALMGIAIGNGAMFGVGFSIAAAGLGATYWKRHVLDKVRYERFIPENRAFAGEDLSLTLRLRNDKWLPVPWIEVRDAIPENAIVDEQHLSPSSSPNYVNIVRSTHLSWFERTSWPLTFHTVARGYYRLGPSRLISGDPFGFFREERDDEFLNSVLIYPKLYTLPELGLPPERPFGELKGRERIFEDPSRIAGLRDYRPGDPMRRIDWKATARSGELRSRVYEPSSTQHLYIAMNVHTLRGSWEGYVPELLERLLSVTGSIARHGFETGYAAGLLANGSYPESDRPMRIPPGRHSDQLSRILEALAGIGPMTLTGLENVVEKEAQRFPFGATMVCVTARMDEPLAASLRRVSRAGHTVVVVSLADHEFEEDLDKIRVYNVSEALLALERAGGAAPP